jgi:hypothetical protein
MTIRSTTAPVWDWERRETMAIERVPLDPSHLEEAARLFGLAFRDDPVMLALLKGRDAVERERCLGGFSAASLKSGLSLEVRVENRMVFV